MKCKCQLKTRQQRVCSGSFPTTTEQPLDGHEYCRCGKVREANWARELAQRRPWRALSRDPFHPAVLLRNVVARLLMVGSPGEAERSEQEH
jgi:hypothetical protein